MTDARGFIITTINYDFSFSLFFDFNLPLIMKQITGLRRQ